MSVGSIRETYAMQLKEMKKDAEGDVKSTRETLKKIQSQRETLEKLLDEEKLNVRACRKKILKEMRTIFFMLSGFLLDKNDVDDTIISYAESLKKIHDLELQLHSVRNREVSAKEEYQSAKTFLENICAAING